LPGAAGKKNEGPERVLGVDPGTVVTGWGVVEGCGAEVRYVASGVVSLRGVRADRLAELYKSLAAICEDVRPSVVAIEKTFVGDNIQTAFRLGEARGAVMAAVAGHGVPVTEYSPAEIKVALTGSGRAGKEQMQAMVGRVLGLDRPLRADEADALAAAVCHAHSRSYVSASATAQLAPRRARRPAAWRVSGR
jgi:crossover junction endodeoxyribonuclease RuvC